MTHPPATSKPSALLSQNPLDREVPAAGWLYKEDWAVLYNTDVIALSSRLG